MRLRTSSAWFDSTREHQSLASSSGQDTTLPTSRRRFDSGRTHQDSSADRSAMCRAANPVSGVRLPGARPRPVARMSRRRSRPSENGTRGNAGAAPRPWPVLHRARHANGKQPALQAGNAGSIPAESTKVSGRSFNRRGRCAPNAGIRVRAPAGRPRTRTGAGFYPAGRKWIMQVRLLSGAPLVGP